MARKKERQRFIALVTQYLIDLGAQHDPDKMYPYSLETQAGILRCDAVEALGKGLGEVFCRFDEPKAAERLLGVGAVNPYSGKWNHHYFDGWDATAGFEDFKCHLGKVLSVGGTEQ